MAAPHPPLSASAASQVQSVIDSATSNPHNVPGCVFAVVNRSGDPIFAHASGKRGIEANEPMSLDSIFWIASCTKLITAIAAVQLVEKGVLKLDDADQTEQLCPEFKDLKILTGFDENDKPIWKEKGTRITLRMCLSHTAGFGYSPFNNELRRFGYPVGIEEFSSYIEGITSTPLIHEPGTSWQYGTSVDWTGIMIERITKQNLDEYFKANIFEPLGVTESTFFPTTSMISRLAFMHTRLAEDKILPYDHICRRPLTATESEKRDIFCSGGAGLFAKPTEYLKIIAALLNDGTSPTTHKSILSPKSVELLLENQIPHQPNFARQGIPAAKPHLTNPLPELFPQPHDQEQGWSFAGLKVIHPAMTGRGKESVQWAGLPNLFWWLDREKGVAGIIASQILPHADMPLIGTWLKAEGTLYASLGK